MKKTWLVRTKIYKRKLMPGEELGVVDEVHIDGNFNTFEDALTDKNNKLLYEMCCKRMGRIIEIKEVPNPLN